MSEEELYCLDCNVPLYTRACRLLPGGVAYVCSVCKHEYTLFEHQTIKKQRDEDKSMYNDMFLTTSDGDDSEMVIEFDKEELASESLRELLTVKDDGSDDDVLTKYDDPIEEV